MEVVIGEIFNVKASVPIKVIPIGDIQLGAESVNEKYLKYVVNGVKNDPNCYWIAMGDMCNFIQVSDPRFDTNELAGWIDRNDVDIVEQQLERLYSYLDPIAHKCLAFVKGNHEYAIEKHYERHPYANMLRRMKTKGELDPNKKLGVNYNGWLILKMYRSGKNQKKKSGARILKFRLNHGSGGGRKSGSKALRMEEFLDQNNCDIALMGHNHWAGMPIRRIMFDVLTNGRFVRRRKIGAYTGTFMESEGDGYDAYSERMNLPPIPIGGVEILLSPHAENEFENRVSVVTSI